MNAGEDGAGLGRRPSWLEPWLVAEQKNLTANVVAVIEARIRRAGGCLGPDARTQLRDDASSAVGLASAEVLALETFVPRAPLPVRVYVIKRASGLLGSDQRQLAHMVLVGEDGWAPADDAAAPVLLWLTSLPHGRPAAPLVAALVSCARGESLAEIADAVRDAGLAVCDGAVVVELLLALRRAKKGHRALSKILHEARDRLEQPLANHLRALGLLDERLLAVVVDHAFGVSDTATACALGISAARVRGLRLHARRQFGFVQACFEAPVALGWPIGPSAEAG